MNKKSKEKAESVHGIPTSDNLTKWLLENLDKIPTLDEIMRAQKKRPKRVRHSEDLEKVIAGLFREIEELKSSGSVSKGLLDHARDLARSWHPELGKSGNQLVVLLAGLVVAQQRELDRLVKFRQLLTSDQRCQKPTSKQQYDIGRRCVPVVGHIEWEFGGVRPPGVTDNNESLIHRHKPPEAPTCLDDIFTGHAVSMWGLVVLFGRDRHLLAKLAGPTRIKKGRETLYDYRTVRDIMNALLSERQKRKRSARRRPPREPWLTDPPPGPDWRPTMALWRVRHYCRQVRGSVREPLRTRVLTGIEGRINSLSDHVPKHIKSAFLDDVIRPHLPDSGKK